MKYTGNLKLLKPDNSDVYDIEHMNENADIIDRSVKTIQNNIVGQVKIKRDIIILSNSWTAHENIFKYKIKDVNITENTVVDVNVHLEDLLTAYSLHSANLSCDGYVEIYAKSKLSKNIKVDIKIVKEVV